MVLCVKKLNDKAVLPTEGTEYSAGYDLYACEDVFINPGEAKAVPTGIAIEIRGSFISERYVILLFARSGLACKHGLSPANCVGVIDEDYRGEVIPFLRNNSDEPYFIHAGDRVAQLVITPIVKPHIQETDTLKDTSRGTGGFGSTGV